ncbi:transcription factor IBH1-like 1 [Rhododendron vialii]|uniref:transcription factor IBH1-like 1 n=1 Tax=Rhododendron vialii TaxID=182163 RepID=UPI00265DEC70|nr:transcription factor IBH1-like 1 [Rhododendron vialii]
MLRQEFLKKWIMGLQICSASKKEMSVLERKKAIKLSADLAIASTRNGSTNWSRALIANASKENDNTTLVDQILGKDSESMIKKASNPSAFRDKRGTTCRGKKMLRNRCCGIRRVKKMAESASSIAKKLVKKRTQVLKRLVPGGESMDEFSLMEETLDYILSLRAQVDVMRHFANATPPN